MNTIGERIRLAREKIGMSQVDMADKIGVSKQNLYKYERGLVTNIPSDKIELIGKLTGVSPAYLMGWDNMEPEPLPPNCFPIEKKKFPLLGNIACGEPTYAEEDWQGFVEVGADINADFCIRAKGDSMIGARIFDGDIIFIHKQDIVENGEIAAVLIEDEATLKRVSYDQDAGILTLYPENPMYKPLRYEGPDLNNIRILGKAVSCQFDIN